MKKSNYNQFIEYNENMIAYNILQRSVSILPDRIVEQINECPDSLSEDELELLYKLGIVVDDDVDELQLFRMQHESTLYNTDTLSITQLLTIRCNSRCLYCYEEGYRELESVSESQADFQESNIPQLCEFIISLANTYGTKKVSFSFHGGEPSLRKDLVEKLCSDVSRTLSNEGLQCMFSMVTNGTLIDSETIESFISFGIDRLLFTLDGDQNIHDHRRPYIDGSGSFNDVYKNMTEAINKGMKIYLGINIDMHNYSELDSLLYRLAEDFHGKTNLILVFALVMPGKNPGSFLTKYCFRSQKKMAESLMDLYEKAANLGLKTGDPFGSPYCSSRTPSDFVISPSGGVYKCVSLVGQQESYVGNITDGSERISKNSAKFLYGWNSFESSEACRECRYLPMCLGGCIQQSILNGWEKDCKKEFFRTFLPRRIMFCVKNNIVGNAGREKCQQ